MAKSSVQFERWKCHERSSWPFKVFQKYNAELRKLLVSHDAGSKRAYSELGTSKAKWSDPSSEHLVFANIPDSKLFKDLKEWSDAYNDFGNWTRLNAVIAMTSNLETYLVTILSLAIESDPGLLLGSPKAVDGILFLKRNNPPLKYANILMECTKGDWGSRISAYEKLFGFSPPILREKLPQLEQIRTLRNNAGHAFGRDIEDSRKHGVLEILPMERLNPDRALRYQRLLWSTAKSIDIHLLERHIGEFQTVRFYHSIFSSLPTSWHPNERAIEFKKQIGRFKATPSGKEFSKGLVRFYENL